MKGLNDIEERQARRIACARLVQGCEGAVSELLLTIDKVEEPPPVTKRARELLAQVLCSWRETLQALKTADERV